MRSRNALSFISLLCYMGLAHGADTEITACSQALEQGDAAKALIAAEQALKANPASHDALICKGRALEASGKFEEALATLQAAEKIAANPAEHMLGLTIIGNTQRDAGQSAAALETYRQGLAIAQAEKDKAFQRIELNLIGDTAMDIGQAQTGLDSYLAASKLAANDNERGDSYARIAVAYSSLGQHTSAIEYQTKAMLMEERAGDLDHYANAGLELGRIMTQAGDYMGAERSINKILKLSKDQGGAYWEARSYYYLAQTKLAAGQTEPARPLLADAMKIAADIGAKALQDEVSQAIGKLPK